jgi:hypothetical protein
MDAGSTLRFIGDFPLAELWFGFWFLIVTVAVTVLELWPLDWLCAGLDWNWTTLCLCRYNGNASVRCVGNKVSENITYNSATMQLMLLNHFTKCFDHSWPSSGVRWLRNITEFHCDGIVYNNFRDVNATWCLNTELKFPNWVNYSGFQAFRDNGTGRSYLAVV